MMHFITACRRRYDGDCVVVGPTFCLSNALHSSIGQNIKSHPCPLSGVQSPVSVLRPECEKLQMAITQQCVRHPIYFVFGSTLHVGWVF